MPIESSGEIRLRGAAGDGRTDINEEINNNVTDTDVSLGTLNTTAFTNVSDGSVVTGRAMSEMQGYSAFTSLLPQTEADGALGESLLLEDDNHVLHTVPLNSNRKTFTFSGWYKFHKHDTNHIIFESGNTSGSGYMSLRIEGSTNKFYGLLSPYGGNPWLARTNELILDNSSWYHIVLAVDTNQQRTNDRFRLYVNGIELKFVYTANSVAQGADLPVNQSSTRTSFSRTIRNDAYTVWNKSSIADAKFIDGTQLRPDSFGELIQGIWIPKAFNKPSTDTLVTSNLLAKYDFNRTSEDSQGSNDGADSNINYYDTNYGIADFNGSSSFIVIPSTLSGSTDTSNFNFSLWFSINSSFSTGSKWIIGENTYTGPYRIGIYALGDNNYSIDFLRRYGGTYYGMGQLGSIKIFPNTFHNISLNYSYSPKKYELFYNGISQGSTSTVAFSGPQTAISTVAIGRYNSLDPSLNFNGKIGEIQVYSDVLNASEALQNYNATKHKYTYGLNGFHLPLNNTSIGSIDSGSNLILHLDASDITSYTGSGTTWSDLTTNNNNGTISGANFLSSTNGGVFDLDGSNDYIEIADNADLRLPGDYTIEGWFNTDALSGDQRIVNKDDAQDFSAGYQIMLNASGHFLWSHNEGSNENWLITAGVAAGKWYHFMAVYSDIANTRYFYLNGKQIAARNTTTNLLGENDKLFIGAYGDQSPSGQYFNGKIGAVRIYNKSLTAQEVITNYRATQGNYEQVSTVDISGNATIFVDSNIEHTDHVPDEPLNNYVTLNPSAKPHTGTYEYQYGNLRTYSASNNVDFGTTGTIPVGSGKWYWECQLLSNNNYTGFTGWLDAANPTLVHSGGYPIGAIASAGTAHLKVKITSSTFATVKSNFFTNGTWSNKISVAFDADTGKLWVKAASDSAWYNNGNPELGTNPTYTHPAAAMYVMFASQGGSNRGAWWHVSEDSWDGTPPDGYKAVSTKNLPAPTFDLNSATPSKPSDHFKAVTYQGNGSTQGEAYGYKEGSKAAVFNGSSSYINTNAKNPVSLNFSISFWMKPSGTAANQYIFSTKSNSVTNGWWIITNGGAVWYGEGNGIDNGVTQTSPLSTYADSEWHHVCVTRAAGGTVNMYIDGSRVITDGAIGSNHMTSSVWQNNLHIGRYSGSSAYFYNGSIDETRIFDKALSSTEVGYLADDDTTNIDAISNLVAHYDMEGDANDTGSYAYGTGAIDSGQSAVFNGSTSKINTGYIQTGQVYTASFWGKGFSAGGSVLRDTPAAGGANTFMDIATGANGQIVLAGNVALDPLNTPSSDWTHYAVVLDGTNATIYANGIELATKTYTAKSGNNGTPIHMMSNGAYHAGFATGSLDQVRIYSSALSPSDVQALASETSVPTTNLVAHYKLDGDATDETTNYNGTWSGAESYSDPAEFPLVAYHGTDTNVTYTQDKPYGNIDVGFAPDLVWIKARTDSRSHNLIDSVRGPGKFIFTTSTGVELTLSTFNSFDSNGFTVSGSDNYINNLSHNYVAWAWKAGGKAVSNSDGSITSQVSANTDAGFSIVKFNGSASGGSVGHGLSSAPELIIHKKTSSAVNWRVLHKTSGSWRVFEGLNTTANSSDYSSYTTVDDTVIDMVDNADWNTGTSSNFINYCFHSVDGYSKIGSYTANGQTSGQFIYTGFKPAFVMIKGSDTPNATNWWIFDNVRNTGNPIGKGLIPNLTNAEQPQGSYIEFNSNGFALTSGNGEFNYSGTYIYMAFAEDPVKYSNGVATLGDGNEFIQDANYPEDNFTATTYAGSGAARTVTTGSFKPDFVWIKNRTTTNNNHILSDSIRGAGKVVYLPLTNAEADESAYGPSSFVSNGFTTETAGGNSNVSGSNYVAWSWKAAGHEYKSASFNGSSSYISTSIPNNDIEAFSFWMYFVSGTTFHRPLGSTVSSSGGNLSVEVGTNGSISCQLQNLQTTASAGALGSTGWKHIYYDTNRDIYINSVLQSTTDSNTSFPASNLLIGALRTTYGFFNSEIDQVRVFNRVLSSGEVTTLYNETKSTVNTLQVLGDSSCIATYRLNGDANDLSGNYNGAESNVDYSTGSHFVYNIYENKARTFSHKASDLSLGTGTITPTDINANRDNGFSIIKYTSNGVAGSTIDHGLSKPPEIIIIKNLDDTDKWAVYNKTIGGTKFLVLNETALAVASSSYWNNKNADHNVFTVGNTSPVNSTSTEDYIAYAWHSVPGFSKIGSYKGNGSSAARKIYTGFEPAFVMIKNTTAAYEWAIIDNKRGGNKELYTNSAGAENSSPDVQNTTFSSDGFTLNASDGATNQNNGTIIYMAFAHR